MNSFNHFLCGVTVNVQNKKDKTIDLDITSLLDIITILLVFLLKSYNASDLKLDLLGKIELPDSKSRTLGNDSVILQVNRDKKVWINNVYVGDILTGDERVDFIYQKLDEIKKQKDKTADSMRVLASAMKDHNKQINIVMDKTLSYKTLRQIMHTSALAGYPEFKFIVQGNY